MTKVKHDLSKRYWCFCYDPYHPNGGLADLLATFENEIPKYVYPEADELESYEYQIFDSQTQTVLYMGMEWQEAINAVDRANKGLDPIETFPLGLAVYL